MLQIVDVQNKTHTRTYKPITTDKQLRDLKFNGQKYTKRGLGNGLEIEVYPSGEKYWRFRYRFKGKQKRLSLGNYREVSLQEARERCVELKKLLRASIDPSENLKEHKRVDIEREKNIFQTLFHGWYSKNVAHQMAESHRKKILRNFERDVLPWIGKKVITDITAPELSDMLDRVQKRGAIETAHRILNDCNRVFDYAIAGGRAKYNPCSPLKSHLFPVQRKHRAAITDPRKLIPVLNMIDGYQGTFIVKCALKLMPLLFLRPKELRTLEWKHVDFESALLDFVSTKKDKDAFTPLATQAIEILNTLKPLTGSGRYVFPCYRSNDRPMSDNAVLSALRRMGITKEETCGHGFRATARTILAERLKCPREIIELQLTHDVLDSDGKAYNRGTFLDERREMMQKWADYLDDLKSSTKKTN